jgi:hypothetical protein
MVTDPDLKLIQIVRLLNARRRKSIAFLGLFVIGLALAQAASFGAAWYEGVLVAIALYTVGSAAGLMLYAIVWRREIRRRSLGQPPRWACFLYLSPEVAGRRPLLVSGQLCFHDSALEWVPSKRFAENYPNVRWNTADYQVRSVDLAGLGNQGVIRVFSATLTSKDGIFVLRHIKDFLRHAEP